MDNKQTPAERTAVDKQQVLGHFRLRKLLGALRRERHSRTSALDISISMLTVPGRVEELILRVASPFMRATIVERR